jgi:hypothetical protein
MAGEPRVWWGGPVAAAACWGFGGVDLAAHHGALDASTVVLALCGGIFIAIRRIDRLTASIPLPGRSGVQVSINELERAAADASALAVRASDTAGEASKLYEHWLAELAVLGAASDHADTAESASRLFRFINTRLEDLSTWVGHADEEVRASLWWWSEADGGACIVAAPRISDRDTLEHVFRPGVGLLGGVLVNGAEVNVDDAPAEPGWQRVAGREPEYHGLLCVPIVLGGRVAGGLTVDRTARERFSEASVLFARQVAALIRVAAQLPGMRDDLVSLLLPAPAEAPPRALP